MVRWRSSARVRHRRHQVVGPGHRRQRHHPHRRRRPQRPGRRARRRVRRDEGRRDHLPDRSRHADLRQAAQADRVEAAAAAPKTVQDIRQALDDKDLDAISIATPNHWHALMTIWACQAGKDVYVEKPCSHNVHEGRIAVEAARKYNRIVQHGTQSRSEPAAGPTPPRSIKSGKLGKLLVSRGALLQAARQHRRQAEHRRRRASSTSTSGSARRRSSRSTPTSSTTTGTGSGTSATATSATRASTRWTSPAG